MAARPSTRGSGGRGDRSTYSISPPIDHWPGEDAGWTFGRTSHCRMRRVSRRRAASSLCRPPISIACPGAGARRSASAAVPARGRSTHAEESGRGGVHRRDRADSHGSCAGSGAQRNTPMSSARSTVAGITCTPNLGADEHPVPAGGARELRRRHQEAGRRTAARGTSATGSSTTPARTCSPRTASPSGASPGASSSTTPSACGRRTAVRTPRSRSTATDPLESFRNDLGGDRLHPHAGRARNRRRLDRAPADQHRQQLHRRLQPSTAAPTPGSNGCARARSTATCRTTAPGCCWPGRHAAPPRRPRQRRDGARDGARWAACAATPGKAMVAGDVRANENIALTATHTLFAREHNRIVAALPRRSERRTGSRSRAAWSAPSSSSSPTPSSCPASA